MKKQELVTIIRNAVKEELSVSLPKLLKEVLSTKEIVSENTRDIDPVAVTKKALAPKRKQTQYSKNAAINKILNETKGGVPQEGTLVQGGLEQSRGFTDHQGQNINVEELPNHLSHALTRNYSDVMKLVDKKKGKS